MAGLIRLLLVLAWVGADGAHLRRTPSLMTGRVLQEANEKTGGAATTAADEIAKDADKHADDAAEDVGAATAAADEIAKDADKHADDAAEDVGAATAAADEIAKDADKHADDVAEGVDAHADELTRKRGMDEKKEKKVVKAEEKEEKEEEEEKEEKALEKEEKEEKEEKKEKKDKDDDDEEEEDEDEDGDDEGKAEDPPRAEMVKSHSALYQNLKDRVKVRMEIRELGEDLDPEHSPKDIQESVKVLQNKTGSTAMSSFIGDMWKDMRMFSTPYYKDTLEKELDGLEKEHPTLEANYQKAKAAVEAEGSPEKAEGSEKDDK